MNIESTTRPRNDFLDLAFKYQHVVPTDALAAVLKQYSWANSGQVLDIVIDNFALLKSHGLVEAAFLEAYSTQRWGTRNWNMGFTHAVFKNLRRKPLLEVSDPLPSGKTFTVYRGVSGTIDVERRVLGYSWTLKSEVAKFFATYHRLPNPNVYTATINRKDVLAYLNASYRNEAEMLLKPDKLVNVRPIRS